MPDVAIPPIAERAEPAELTEAAARLEDADAQEIVRWAAGRFEGRWVLASSFEDSVLIDIVSQVAERLPVLFIDTGFHFPETLQYVQQVRDRYRLSLHVARADLDAATHPCGSSQCCAQRKVVPIRRALEPHAAWLTGLRRADGPTRAHTSVVAWDEMFGIAKVAPLARWTDADVHAHVVARDLPVHPLLDRGYRSIGCAPATRPVADGEDSRAGRWPGQAKTECGLHA